MRFLGILFALATLGVAQSHEPLRFQKTILLPGVEGRIDHISIDVNTQRLFMAALGNNTVEVIDIARGKRIHSIPGLHEPQGVLYLLEANRLYVANGHEGTLRILDGNCYEPIRLIPNSGALALHSQDAVLFSIQRTTFEFRI
jgi:DNA-binding beta-propeller fold protein YncE